MKTNSLDRTSLPSSVSRLPFGRSLTRRSISAVSRASAVVSALVLAWALSGIATELKAQDQCVTVNVYSGFNPSGGGAPYSGLVGSFQTANVSFATDNAYNWHPFGLLEFGADITGVLSVAANGTYTFTLDSDDGALLYIDGSLVVDNGDPHAPQTSSGSVTLTPGLHCFEIQFFECCGGPSGVDLILPTGVSYACVGNECPLSQGYWKTHGALWPVDTLTLGSVTYTKEQLIAIMTSPSQNDASLILAKQLLAALLNIANGSDPTPLCGTIAEAHALLDGCTVPCAVDNKSQSALFQAMVNTAAVLEMYNTGVLTPGCTSSIP